MSSLVLELQKECLDPTISILPSLRKALVVAKKLSVIDFQIWIEKELQGYMEDDSVPEYRVLKGQLVAWNPYNGWIPVLLSDPEKQDQISLCGIGQPIGEIENMVKHADANSTLEVPLATQIEHMIRRAGRLPLKPTRHITMASAGGIVEQVRNIVLNWTLRLEKDGILGDGMSFSEKEKQSASQTNYNVTIGQVTTLQLQQGTYRSSQSISQELDTIGLRDFLRKLQDRINELGLQPQERELLVADAKSIEGQLISPKPKHTVIDECLKSIKNILEGCAGSLAATTLLKGIAAFLSH
jgi:AbiTii